MRKNKKNILFSKYGLLFLSAFLFASSFISVNYFHKGVSISKETKQLEKYLHKQQQDFNDLLNDTSRISQVVNKQESLESFKKLTQKDYGIYFYTTDLFGTANLKFWNQQLIVPPPEMQGYADGEYYLSLSNGQYLAVKKTITAGGKQGNVVACALMLIHSEFYIETTYLPEEFPYSKDADKRISISSKNTPYPVKSLTGKTLCFLNKKTAAFIPINDKVTNILMLGALLLLVIFIHLFIESGIGTCGSERSILLLAVILAGLRVLTYLFPSLLDLRQFELFDPAVYGSNPVLRSLGDLLINSILVCWVVLYAWSRLDAIDKRIERFTNRNKWLTGLLSLALLLFSTFALAALVRNLIADSKISFDVTDFFSLNRFTVIGFVVLTVLSITYYYFSQLLLRFLQPLFRGRPVFIYFSIGVAGLIYLTLLSGHSSVIFYLPVLVWLLCYSLLLLNQQFIFTRFRINMAGILFWIFIFSVSISAIMLSEIKKAEWEKRKIIAERLVENTDPSGERLLSIALAYLDNNFLTNNFYRFYDKHSGKKFRDSIITENYTGYLNKYETKLYVYDAAGKTINNDDPTTLNDMNVILGVQSRPTKVPGLYYYETSFDKFTYITKREVLASDQSPLGYLFIISNPRKYISDALFPELFRQLKQAEPENSPIYSYAIYKNKSLVSPTNKYPFATSLQEQEIPKEVIESRIRDNYYELWYRASADKVVVIARKQDSMIETITLFSYIFCSFLFLVAFVQLLSKMIGSLKEKSSIRKLFQLNIRRQVHSTIIFISILSFFIIGIATISFFISRYNRNNKDKLSRTMQVMVNEMRKKMADHKVFDDVIKVYDPVAGTGLQKLVNEVADVHDVDVNIYDFDGNLQVSSEANVYAKGVVSKKMDPVAYFHLNRLRQVQHVQKEKIAKLSYLSIYAPVRDEEGSVDAYLNIPYFASQRELNLEISNFLVTIINLNAFIFLIAGVIALFITNRITRSFSLISDKMKEINIGSVNEAIEWNRIDEIGELVNEYNKMVAKLEDSASTLAKSEREGAWREMARQVAHEIKNPLTPMKLSIQYLQKAIDNNQPNVKELTGTVAKTLVEQIDHLSKIAADFSQFANIGTTNIEFFDLHEVISSLKDLYQPNKQVELIWYPVVEKLMLHADKTQMNRLFTNLFTNAMEACQGNGICQIEVNERKDGDKIIISIKDNGEGIPAEMQERIFIPNFTTKSSGTGLGLAMCKGIVEQAKGKIWFETEQGRVSTFYVELPLVN